MKKLIAFSVAIATIVWSLGLGALIPAASAAYTPTAGDIIKVSAANRPGVYIVGADMKTYVFSTRSTYASWLDDFSSLKNITQTEFDALNLGGNVTVKPGSLIRFDNSDNVYVAVPGNKLCKLPTTVADAKALYGVDYEGRVLLIQVSFVGNYTVDPACALNRDSKLPDGSLIQYAGSSDTYYLENGIKRLVNSEPFTANGFKRNNVIKNVAISMAYENGNPITGAELNISGVTMTNSAARVRARNGKVTFTNSSFADGYGFQYSSDWNAAVSQYDSENALFGPQANSGSGLGGVEVTVFAGDLNAWLQHLESNTEIRFLSNSFTTIAGADAMKATIKAENRYSSSVYIKKNGKIYSIYINSNNTADLEKYNQIINSFYFIQ